MTDEPTEKDPRNEPTLASQVGDKAERKIKAQRNVNRTVWLGLGMMGLIGWSVVIPTLFGAALGLWLDKHYPVSACPTRDQVLRRRALELLPTSRSVPSCLNQARLSD